MGIKGEWAMSARSFRSVGWVAAVAATALGCYMINLKVAAERAALEEVETRIALAQRDIRVLQTEIGTRGRLAQLEKWNVRVLALSAPSANQFLEGGFQLATLVAPKKVIDPAAPVVLASAPAAERKPVLTDDGDVATPVAAADLMHTASLKRETRDDDLTMEPDTAPEPRVAMKPAPSKAATVKSGAPSGTAPALAKKSVEKPAVTRKGGADKPLKIANAEAESPPKPSKAKAAAPKSAAPATKPKTRSKEPAAEQ